jgi:hypothetical protein
VASKSLVEWLKMLWENKRVSARRALVGLSPYGCLLSPPAAGGFVPLL